MLLPVQRASESARVNPMVKIILSVGGAICVLLLLVVIWPFYSVSAGYVGVKTWFSNPETVTLAPGIHFVVPIAESVREISIQPQLASTTESASTSDQQDVSTGVSVNFSVNPLNALTLFENYRDIQTLDSTIIAPIVSNDTKAVTAKYNAQELITKRSQVRSEIEAAIRSDLAPYGVVIVSGVNITDFQYSADYTQAINTKQDEQQAALQEQYKLQGVQIEAQQQVAQAQAQAEAAVDVAEGAAKATVLQAQADAQAYTLKQKALTPELVELALINKWNGTMPTYTSNALPTTLFGINPLQPSSAP